MSDGLSCIKMMHPSRSPITHHDNRPQHALQPAPGNGGSFSIAPGFTSAGSVRRSLGVKRLMHSFTCRVLFPLCILAWCLASSAQDSTGQSMLMEGAWTHRGLKTVIGEGTDTTVVVSKETNTWTIAFESIRFPSIVQKDARPVTHREGPYIATVDDKELIFTRDGKEVRYTFL